MTVKADPLQHPNMSRRVQARVRRAIAIFTGLLVSTGCASLQTGAGTTWEHAGRAMTAFGRRVWSCPEPVAVRSNVLVLFVPDPQPRAITLVHHEIDDDE